ncbi:MAG TPA: DUF2489 domain-containing protein [Burkholderiaceae bacterium]
MSRPEQSSEEYIASVRAELVSTARALRSQELPFLEGVQRLLALRSQVSRDDHDSDFMLFVAIGSEADHIPPARARKLCSESWLAKCDQEARELEAFYRVNVSTACERLVERFSETAG